MPPHDPSPSHEITVAKASFLTTQIRLLKSPLQPPESSPLPPPTTQSVIDKVNKKITSHNRQAYAIESQRHIVEQLDSLYWRDVLNDGLPLRKVETVIRRNADLTSILPETWDDVLLERPKKRKRGNDRDESDENRYNTLRDHLGTKIQRRNELEQKIAQYRKLRKLLVPFERKEDVQPNLVTRDNKELHGELARTRVLLARVASALQNKEAGMASEDSSADSRTTNAKKLAEVLELG